MISHPFMTSAQPRDPSRVSPVQQYDTFVEPNVHQQSMAAVTLDEANVDVHRLGHAVVIYFFLVFYVCCFLFYFITNYCYVFFFTY